MNHEKWSELADIYSLGALDGEDLRAFEGHLASGCEECRRQIQMAQDVLTLLPQSLAKATPSPALKTRLMDRIAQEAAPAAGQGFRWAPFGWGLAGLAAAAVIALVTFQNLSKNPEPALEKAASALRSEPADLKAAPAPVVTARPEAAAHIPWMRVVLTSPNVQSLKLNPLDPGSGVQAKMYWNPVAGAGSLRAKGLAPLEANMAYHVWAVADDSEPVLLGTVTADKTGHVYMDIPNFNGQKDFSRFAVTLEPEGAAPLRAAVPLLQGSF